jgi:hypothetical protein
VYNVALGWPGYSAYCSVRLEGSKAGYRQCAVQLQGVHGLAQHADMAPGYALSGQLGVYFFICTISEANSIMKFSGELVSLGCSRALGVP